MKFTTTTIQKLETLLEEAGYDVRYEKGNFNSGYCLLENKKVVVVNRFFDTEARGTVLADIVCTLDFSQISLTEKSTDLYQKVLKNQATAEF
jgi:hypothetical protein